MNSLLYVVSALIILVGLVGVFVPFLPGIALIYVGILLASYVGHFSFISITTLVLFGMLTILSFVIDYVSGVLGAKLSGASAGGVVGAVLGTFLGVSLLGPLGIIVGPALGVLAFEYFQKNDVHKSFKSARYTLISAIVGLITNVLIALIMIGTFLFALIF